MTMSNAPENFNDLRKLLALKRHEQPPPGYFNHFSDKIIARIEAAGLAAQTQWWQRMFTSIEARPILACAYGLLIGGLLVVGMGVSQSAEADYATAPALANPWFTAAPLPVSAPRVGDPAAAQLVSQTDPASSVNPVISSGPPSFLFDVNGLKVERASATFR
jgi:hypothetical protein